ncbi:MAG: RluA family pseudouridine synthase [Kiritimatiellae bacterium]|nr:RluA family pseudouridine synthase [Kiritimatiellia bacterium]
MNIIYEDAAILVADKEAGVYVHPAPGHESGTLSDEFVAHCPGSASVGSSSRPGVVHRLDADTSGVIVFAKTQSAYLFLRKQFETHKEVKKTYLAVCHGAPRPGKGVIESMIGRLPRRALSRYETLGRNGPLALVRFDIETGRMHQIRIHAKELGHPIAGDPLYGDRKKDLALKRPPARTLLHAVELSFIHPISHRRVSFSSPPPQDIVFCG